MKNIYCLLIVAAILSASFKPKTEPTVVDVAAVKAEVTAAMDKWHDAYRGKDLTVLSRCLLMICSFVGLPPCNHLFNY